MTQQQPTLASCRYGRARRAGPVGRALPLAHRASVRRAPGRSRRTAGFSLVETMLALAILAMIVALVVPALLSMLSDATGERARGEITAALADARSLSRSTSKPVAVGARQDAEGRIELVGVVLAGAEDLADRIRTATGDAGDDVVDQGEQPSARGVRLAILPDRCRVTYQLPAAENAGGDDAETDLPRTAAGAPASVELGVIFPDGTASVSTRRVYLVVSRAGQATPDLREIKISSWFGEATFTTVETPAPGGEIEPAPSDDESEPAATPVTPRPAPPVTPARESDPRAGGKAPRENDPEVDG